MTKLIALFLGMVIIGMGSVALAQTMPHNLAMPRNDFGVAAAASLAVDRKETVLRESGWPESLLRDVSWTSGLPMMKLPDWKDALQRQLIDWHIRRAA